MSRELVIDTIGWIGTVIFLLSYMLVSLKKVEGDSLGYQAMNIVAGLLLVVNTFYWHAYPSFALNAIWIGIGVFTLARKYSKG